MLGKHRGVLFEDGSALRRLFRKETLELDVEGSGEAPQRRKRRERCSWWKEKPMSWTRGGCGGDYGRSMVAGMEGSARRMVCRDRQGPDCERSYPAS